jgi:hypothetical protein
MKVKRITTLVALSVAFVGVSAALQTAAADPAADAVARNDKDSDRTLDLDEVKASASAHFDRLDKDGDHTLEAKEVKGVLGPKAFAAADPDHDGTLSKDEYLALVEKLFKEADPDHDGTLSAAELKSPAGQRLRRLIN